MKFEDAGMCIGDKVHIDVNTTVCPFKIPVRKQPLALREKFKSQLDRLVEKYIITPVEVPTDWISSFVVVTELLLKVRLCKDPKPLNTALKRNQYTMPNINDLLPELSKAKVYSVADALNGFWRVELDDVSSYLTTFGTARGIYRWKCVPFGIAPAPEEFLYHTCATTG